MITSKKGSRDVYRCYTCALSNSKEHFWRIGEDADSDYLLAGTLLGGKIIRVRLLRGGEVTHIHRHLQDTQLDIIRYQLADEGPGTLPYHSWVVAKGDERWPNYLGENEARSILEPYLQGFAYSPDALRLTRPLASTERQQFL